MIKVMRLERLATKARLDQLKEYYGGILPASSGVKSIQGTAIVAGLGRG